MRRKCASSGMDAADNLYAWDAGFIRRGIAVKKVFARIERKPVAKES